MPLTPVSDVVKVAKHLLLVGGQVPGLPGRRQDGCLRGELVVKVADVLTTLDGRDKWRPDLLCQEGVPVDVLLETQQRQEIETR